MLLHYFFYHCMSIPFQPQLYDCVCVYYNIAIIMSLKATFGEGNGTPLQYSCLENPMDRGAWQTAVHGVAKSRTRLSDFTFTFHFMHWRRKWQPTPVFLPGESQGRGSLEGYCLWGHTESDMTEVTQHSIAKATFVFSFLVFIFFQIPSQSLRGDMKFTFNCLLKEISI